MNTNSEHDISIDNTCKIVQTTKIETYFMVVSQGVLPVRSIVIRYIITRERTQSNYYALAQESYYTDISRS